ncbi:hypothetical protein O3P69_012680, partial [Scylla paramamosain]
EPRPSETFRDLPRPSKICRDPQMKMYRFKKCDDATHRQTDRQTAVGGRSPRTLKRGLSHNCGCASSP